MKKEDKYRQQMEELGIYHSAFDETIHQLCILERELSRTMKAWKATVPKDQPPSPTHDLYAVITVQRKEIANYRDALGLTPKSLRKLKGKENGGEADSKGGMNRRLDALIARCMSYDQ